MKKESFYQFIVKQISKNSYNRMNLPNFTRILRKKAHDVSSTQLLFVYKELQKIKSKNSQSYLSGQKVTDQNKSSNLNALMKIQSYEKHTLICLQEIAIKFKQKNGYQEGFDLCKLLYYRLLNAIEFNLPHAHILEQFRQEFLWKDLGEDIVDYVGLIEKDPSNLSQLYIETVNHIIQTASQELEQIDVLQLPRLKFALSKGQSFATYQIDEIVMKRLDQLINKNKFLYSFKELESSLVSQQKNNETHLHYSLMSKDLAEKRLNYMFIDQKYFLIGKEKNQSIDQIINQLGLPGKIMNEEYFNFAFRKIQQINLFGVYIDIFQQTHRQKQIDKTQLAQNYIKYHFKYFTRSSNGDFPKQKINEVLNNTFESKQKMKQKGMKFQHISLLKLLIICQMLSRKDMNSEKIRQSHKILQKQLEKLNLVHKPKLEDLGKIFQNSLTHYEFIKQNDKNLAQKTLFEFLKETDNKILTDLFSSELSSFSTFQKNFVTNEFNLRLIYLLLENNSAQNSQMIGKVLQILMKLQYKKFSKQFSNVHKLLNLIQQKQNFLHSQAK